MRIQQFFALAFVLVSAVFNTQAQEKKTIDRPGYRVQYFADMTIDSTDEDFDFDSYFTLNVASDNGTINFFIFDEAIDAENAMDVQIKAFKSKVFKDGADVVKFDKWGKYKGSGAVITGVLMESFPGEVKIFAYTDKKRAFLVVSQIFESDRKKDAPGLKLMESTFTLK